MNRRTFLAAGLTAGAMAISGAAAKAQQITQPSSKRKFKLKYAPHFGMFRHNAGNDLIDELKFIADVGFTALEDNGMMKRSKDEQEKIAHQMSRLDMTMGVFVAYGEFHKKTFVTNNKSIQDMLVKNMKSAVEVAKRLNAKWCTVVPGAYDNAMEWDYQTANAIENLKRCAEVCEPAGLVMVLEPLNAWQDHPGLFLTKIPQAYQICRAVGSSSCKILDDLYHQQITEGNLIPNIDMAWDEIAYFQVGDNPGRKEPTTGEINYKNVFKHLYNKDYEGIIGMEHGNSKPGKEGERAVIEAYRACDSF
ncbi:MAG: TIM barrel protein [Planctomycetota bacterium]|nr:MAG: TIM barrel protein [Planctomycetota bacterium]